MWGGDHCGWDCPESGGGGGGGFCDGAIRVVVLNPLWLVNEKQS